MSGLHILSQPTSTKRIVATFSECFVSGNPLTPRVERPDRWIWRAWNIMEGRIGAAQNLNAEDTTQKKATQEKKHLLRNEGEEVLGRECKILSTIIWQKQEKLVIIVRFSFLQSDFKHRVCHTDEQILSITFLITTANQIRR